MRAVTTTTGGTAVLEKVFYTSVLVSDQDRALETDDVRKTFEELKSRGVEFVSDVLEFPWVTSRSSRTPTATGYRYKRAASFARGRLSPRTAGAAGSLASPPTRS
jgi:hypothetical protein